MKEKLQLWEQERQSKIKEKDQGVFRRLWSQTPTPTPEPTIPMKEKLQMWEQERQSKIKQKDQGVFRRLWAQTPTPTPTPNEKISLTNDLPKPTPSPFTQPKTSWSLFSWNTKPKTDRSSVKNEIAKRAPKVPKDPWERTLEGMWNGEEPFTSIFKDFIEPGMLNTHTPDQQPLIWVSKKKKRLHQSS
jgi:hypothetical protein